MKTKKYVIAFAICLGALVSAQATNVIDLEDQNKTEVSSRRIAVS